MSWPIKPTRVDVTRHALQRFRERIDGTADVAKVEALVRERDEARKRRDWREADLLRARIEEAGAIVEDTPKGSRWKAKPAASEA